MHRLFLGLNLWSALFMTGAVLLGRAHSPWHQRGAIFAAIFACLVQSGAVALFLGAAKLVKEHVGRFGMPLAIIDRLNHVYHRLIPMAVVGASLTTAAAVIGAQADVGRLPLWAHVLPAVVAWLYLIAVIPLEYRLQRRLNEIVGEVERLLPAPGRMEETRPHEAYRPDQVRLDHRGRAKGLLYIGLTLPLPYLGYTFISSHDVSYLLAPTILLTAGCLVWAAWESRSARRQDRG